MPKQRESAGLLEFHKMATVGERVLGKVTRHDVNENGAFITLEPVLIRHAMGDVERFGGIALGLTADLKGKVSAKDVGKLLVIGLVGRKESKKGQPTKLFSVYEVEAGDDARAVIANGELFKPVVPKSDDAGALGDDDDDLPF